MILTVLKKPDLLSFYYMFRLKIDLRSSRGLLFEEHDFQSEIAAQDYYKQVRDEYGKDGLRVESRSTIMEHIGSDQVDCWSMRHVMTENVQGKMFWKRKL